MDIVAPGSGTLAVSIEQRGVSVSAVLLQPGGTGAAPAASAIERFGTITLAHRVLASNPVNVRISSQDAKPLSGEVCTSVQLVASGDRVRTRAEEALAAAGQAVYSHRWRKAFRDFLTAARALDALGEKSAATEARHSMAELANMRLSREHDSYALVADILSRSKSQDPVQHSVHDFLLARALLDQPELNGMNGTMRARKLLDQSRALLAGTPWAQRELPRLNTFQGFIEYSDNRPSEATQLFTQAAEDCAAIGDWQCYAHARQNNAALAEEQKDYSSAARIYEDALNALRLVPEPDLRADIADNLGRLQARMGLYGKSEQSRKIAIQLYARLRNCTGARRSAASLGMLLMSVGSMADASTYLDQAVSASCPQLLGAISAPTGVLRNVAMEPQSAGASRNDIAPSGAADASTHCNAASDLGTETVDDKIAVFAAFVSLSNAFLTQDDVGSAKRCLKLADSYAVTPRAEMRLAYMTGMVALHQRQALTASRAFTNALRIADKANLPESYVYRGFAHLGLAQSALLAGRPEIASREALYELRMSSMRSDAGQIVASLRLLAGSYRDSGRLEAAVRTLRLAVRLIDHVPIAELDGEKRATYLATQHAVFSDLSELLIDGAQLHVDTAWDAFEVSELGRARSLRYAANQADYDNASSDQDDSEEFRALLDRVRAVAQSSPNPRDLVQALSGLEREHAPESESAHATRIVKTLDRLDSTLIEYIAGQRDMFAFVIDRGRIYVANVGNVEVIARAAAKLNDRLRAPEPVPTHIRAAADELARLVFWPISKYVSTDRIIFVPDDALHTIPFAVLPWSAENPDSLIVHHAETTLLASADLLSHYEEKTPYAANRFTLIGDPVFRSADWRRECGDGAAAPNSIQTAQDYSRGAVRGLTRGDPHDARSVSDWAESLRRLPGTRDEVLAIAQLVRDSRPASTVKTLIRCAATPAALRAAASGDGALLHIATHGRIDSHRPRLSALALTPDKQAQGNAAFSLLDILNLRLHSRLVVLSACDTSRGRLLPGEGVLGLAQAFLQAGASSVVASFWRVQDAATADFMKNFYRHLIAERMSASAALRRAQLDRASTDGTYSWAAFSLYGAPDTAL